MEIAIVGAGRVGLCLASQLSSNSDFHIRLADSSESAVSHALSLGYTASELDATRQEAMLRWAKGADCLVSAGPNWLAPAVRTAATKLGCHSVDFVADDGMLRSPEAGRAHFTGCGVSPGLVEDIAFTLIECFDSPPDVVIRVGALPTKQVNRLGYGLIWSVDELFDEYTSSAEAIVDGVITTLLPLSGHETLELNGTMYESFVTAGGIGSMFRKFQGRVNALSVRTIRYLGHRDCIAFLLDDLRLSERRDLFKTLMHRGLPEVTQELLLVVVSARGVVNGQMREEQIVAQAQANNGISTLALASAAYAAALIDRLNVYGHESELDEPSAHRFSILAGSPYLSRVITFQKNVADEK